MYEKVALSINQQIDQLKARGLKIDDADNAPHFLSHISYYRLAGYWWRQKEAACARCHI